MSYDWWTDFQPYSPEHALCVGICAAIMGVTALTGLKLRGTRGGDRLRFGVAWTGILYWLGSNAWWMWGPQYTFAQSLPLQVCDLAGLVGPMALLTRKQWLRAILYFWGLGLSIQGFIQPVLKDKGLGDVEFWLFWANHTMIVGTAVYDLVALGFRPKTRDFLIAVGASLAYVAVIAPFDMIFKVNYGYVGEFDPIPHEPTLGDKLGPWPQNAAILVLLGIFSMAVMWLPWLVLAWWRRSRNGRAEADAR